jgi:hypothetical protein
MSVIFIVSAVLLVIIPTFLILADYMYKKQFEDWAVNIVIEARMCSVIEKLGLE